MTTVSLSNTAHWTRLAVIADVHGNLPALEAVLADAEREGADAFVCLGDVAYGGPQPTEAIARLRDLGAPTVLGNTDAYLLTPRVGTAGLAADPRVRQVQLDIEAWGSARLAEADRDYLRTFARRLEFKLGGSRVVAYHGSPRNYDDQIRADTAPSDLDLWFADAPADLYLGAHTHEQFARRFKAAVVVNPGSVGMPLRGDASGEQWHPAVGEYALVQVIDGLASVHLRKVAYDLRVLVDAARGSGMPHAGPYVGRFRAS